MRVMFRRLVFIAFIFNLGPGLFAQSGEDASEWATTIQLLQQLSSEITSWEKGAISYISIRDSTMRFRSNLRTTYTELGYSVPESVNAKSDSVTERYRVLDINLRTLKEVRGKVASQTIVISFSESFKVRNTCGRVEYICGYDANELSFVVREAAFESVLNAFSRLHVIK